ncbi:uncharacterized protein LOC134711036 [Mytilus trossulus]|uniref:uncharacterized protein LOC134711036 n=1 Tax=Mytilus trossulus TaxID=6551 RepID=UPI0030075CCB
MFNCYTLHFVLHQTNCHNAHHQKIFLVIVTISQSIRCWAISGCPVYGCQPSGTFSFSLELPSSEPKVIWNNTFGPVWNSLGCVGNCNKIVCLYRGLRIQGYVAIDKSSGKQIWYADALWNLTLPVMDMQGGIIWTDGHTMVKYEANGTQVKPSIPIPPFLYPCTTYRKWLRILVFASMAGIIFAYDTHGIPVASIPLPGTLDQVNGTFIPVSTPAIVENRVYVLTEFKPRNDTEATCKSGVEGRQGLYAIDVFPRMADRLHISWYFDFELVSKILVKHKKGVDTLTFDLNQRKQIHERNEKCPRRTFWAIKDKGDSSSLTYKRFIPASRMAMYETNGAIEKRRQKEEKYTSNLLAHIASRSSRLSKTTEIQVWLLAQKNNLIYKVLPLTGSVETTINLSTLLGGEAEVTSDIMVSRKGDNEIDSLIFGVTVMGSINHNLVVSLDAKGEIQWKIKTPYNVSVL